MAYDYVSLYRQVLAIRQQRYDVALVSGEYTPILYPIDSLPALYVLLAIAISPRLPLKLAKAMRYVAFVLIVLHGAYLVSHRRTLWFAGGYSIGLVSLLGIVNAAALLLFNDVGSDFKRLEVDTARPKVKEYYQNGSIPGSTSSDIAQVVNVARRNKPSIYTSTGSQNVSCYSGPVTPATSPHKFIWQGYPHCSTWHHVLDWTVDLTTSIRGVGWNHRLPTLAPIDALMARGLSTRQKDDRVNIGAKPTAGPLPTLRSLQFRGLQDFILGYLLLDFLKTTMITDPYFLGMEPLESPSPWRWLAQLNGTLPIATRVVRLSMSLAGVIAALTFIFSLNPLFFTFILPSLVDVSKITRSPLLEPWLYPPHWHSLTTSVCYSGLAGLWGKFWHQMFRYGITEPSRVLIEKMRFEPRGSAARLIQLFVAFGLSGSIHAAGSYTSFSLEQTHPFSGPLLFFLLQAVCILVVSSTVNLLHKHIPATQKLPAVAGQTVNVLVVLFYLYFTGPLLANDFARSGIWLLEPVPLSPLRGLGFGPGGKDEGWWTWYQEGSRTIGWWKGNGWWERGLAIY